MIILFFVILIIGFIYRPWFSVLPLSSGDWPYLFVENIREFSFFPEIRFLWLAPYYQVLTKIVVQYFGLSWNITEKLFWFLPFVLLSLFSSYRLTKSAIGALIYTTNTYAIMIIGGGQLGIALSYAVAPLVFKRFIDQKQVFLNGIILAIQVMFDPRIALLTLFGAVLYHVVVNKDNIVRIVKNTGTSIVISIILHLYWIIPLLKYQLPLGDQLSEATAESAKFLSFATFEQTISLLHPNWPENIFGKVYFMRPEFLFIAIFAFSSLLVKTLNQKMIYFALIALIGAFLAKGTNPPFGEVYGWLFNHVPGFILFRDPTKFYLYPAIAFSILIPFALERVDKGRVASLLFILFWMFTIRQALFGQLTGTFRPQPVPQEYVELKDFLHNQTEPFKTLWIPQRQRFGFASQLHPSIDAQNLSKESSISGMLEWIEASGTQNELEGLGVKYVIVPYDSRGELFISDRKYDEQLYKHTYLQVQSIPWLRRIDAFPKMGVFEL